MKKTLAILLVLMLVLVPVTAMAAVGVSNDTNNFTRNSASTEFKVEVDTSNISATVPLNLVFVANANGGALTMPNGYSIKNNSALALNVASISTSTLNAPGGANTSPTFCSNEALTPSANNMFYMTLNGQVLSASMVNAPLSGTVWNIPAKTADPGTCNIAVVGSNTTLDFTTTNAATLFTVTYTIAVGSHADS